METGLTDKTVVITGASGGIGSAVARRFAAEGARVAIHYHHGLERAQQLQSELPANLPSMLVGGDLTDESQVSSMFQAIEQELGPPHVLIANAGVWPKDDTPIAEMSLQRWRKTIDANLTSVFLCCREFLQQTRQANLADPAIVMIGSTAGHFGEANHGDYAAAKSGLMQGLLQSLKNEMPKTAPGGRINVVCPGWTMTPMADKFQADQEAVQRALQTIALKKFATPDDIAKTVLFFAANELSGHITGQSLFVSGGMEGRVLHTTEELES